MTIILYNKNDQFFVRRSPYMHKHMTLCLEKMSYQFVSSLKIACAHSRVEYSNFLARACFTRLVAAPLRRAISHRCTFLYVTLQGLVLVTPQHSKCIPASSPLSTLTLSIVYL